MSVLTFIRENYAALLVAWLLLSLAIGPLIARGIPYSEDEPDMSDNNHNGGDTHAA